MALSPGDIALTSLIADNPDQFTFLALVDIAAGEEIFFTDNGVFADGSFRNTEGIVKYTVPAGGLGAGTVVSFAGNTDFTSEAGALAFSTSGDQLFAFVGSVASPTFLYGVQTNATVFQATATSSTTSALPPGLVLGQTAVAVGAGSGLGDEVDNAAYGFALSSGTKAQHLAAIGDPSNWSGSDLRFEPATDPVTVTVGTGPVLVINEVDADTPGSDAAEFVELYDGGWGNTPLDGLVLVFFNGSTDRSYGAIGLDGFSTDANGFFVLGNPGVPNVDVTFPTNDLQNGADAVALYEGSAFDFVDGTAVTNVNLRDALVYDTNDGDDLGLLVGLGAAVQFDEDTVDKEIHSNSRVPDGTGTFIASLLATPGAANVNLATSLSIDDLTLPEGDAGVTDFDFTVSLSVPVTHTVTVEFATAVGPADANDFTATGGSLTFLPGQTSQTITVPVSGDTLAETDEAFTVSLSKPVGASLVDAEGTGTILDDDTPFSPVPLLLTEIAVSPTGGEFIEIHNPGTNAYDLSNVYLTDATFATGGVFYHNLPTGADAGGGGFGDFHARFPAGASLAAGDYLTVALAGSADFVATYGIAPDYELFDDGNDTGEAAMREALPGSINGQGGLSNSGEVVVLYEWDGASDLVQDHDYAVWGDKAEAVDKTGIAIDGPDADGAASAYAADTAIADQEAIATGSHPVGRSFQRTDLTEGAEAKTGGNGLSGHDETSENLSQTWRTATPTPGAATSDAIPAPYGFDFETPFAGEGWRAVSVDSDTANTWFDDSFSGDNFAEVNGFGDTAPANDWLISPRLDISGLADPVASFATVKNFDDALADPEVTFLYSGDYSGTGDPTLATWTAIPYAASPGGFTETFSGELDLTGLPPIVHVAFQYQSSGTGAGTSSLWQVDDVFVGEASPVIEPILARIHEIQGTGAVSPLAGEVVTITAVVTADFQDSADSDYNGFFLQEEDADQDADPLSSEGIFVFDGGNGVDVAVGDVVSVTGTVVEFAGETQITEVTAVSVHGTSTTSAAPVVFPIAATTTNADGRLIGDFEAYEGMLVTIPEALTVGDLFTLGRYNEVGVTSGGRVTQFTQDTAPSVAGFAQFQEDVAKRGLMIDDPFNSNGAQNSDIAFPQGGGLNADTPNILRSGDTVSDLTGVMTYRAPSTAEGENFRLVPTVAPQFVADNPRPEEAPDPGGSLTVASFNVLNYFVTDDDNTPATGPAGDQEARGAELGEGTSSDGGTEFQRQQAKIVAALDEIDADIVGLIEIENDPTGSASLQALVEAVNAVSARTYAFVDTGPIEGIPGAPLDGDAIKVGFIYDVETVSVDSFAILDISIDARFDSTNQRPALAATFTETASDERLTVAVNHFKSKGSPADFVGDEDSGDGQAAANATRTGAAEALVDWLATDPTGAKDEDVLIIGDLNAYLQEDPIQAILDGADDTRGTGDDFTSLVGADDYTFGFPVNLGGLDHVQAFGTLDYALANAGLLDQITGTEIWHINADEAVALDYNLDFQSTQQQIDYFAPDPFRSSDHDPVIVGLDLGRNVAPVIAELAPVTVRELAKPGTVVAHVEASDGDGDAVTFRIVSGNTDGAFAIDAVSGAITVADRLALGDGAGPFALGLEATDGTEVSEVVTLAVTLDDLLTLNSNDRVIVRQGADDAVIAGEGNNLILAGAGADVVLGGRGDDSIFGNRGRDDLSGGDGDDLLHGNLLDDCLFGQGGDDTLRGGRGEDTLHGGQDSDRLFGGPGDDVLLGGAGNDTMTGGGGADTFRFLGAFGQDTIRGFNAQNDVLDFGAEAVTFAQARGGVLFTVTGTGHTVLVRGLDPEAAVDLAPETLDIA